MSDYYFKVAQNGVEALSDQLLKEKNIENLKRYNQLLMDSINTQNIYIKGQQKYNNALLEALRLIEETARQQEKKRRDFDWYQTYVKVGE